MKRVRASALILLLMALSIVLSACASPVNRVAAGTLRTAAGSDMATMDVAHNTADYQVALNVFDRLFETRMIDGEASELEGIVIHDDTHFSITLEGANAGFVAELSSPAMSIVNARTTKAAKSFGIDPAEHRFGAVHD